MTNVRPQLLRSVHCQAITGLTAVEAARVRVVSGEVPAEDTSLQCEIAAGHDGSHIALATVTDEDRLWWWLCWEDQTREIRQIDLCDGRDRTDPYQDECLLPEGHPGAHSYDIRHE